MLLLLFACYLSPVSNHEMYMRRCLQLAALGAGQVAPNPMVGSVLVHEGRIIGEGYHRRYGDLHAEPNCLNSVPAEQEHLISQSTLYVSLEPCAHFGKTPPCADTIIRHKIPEVVVGIRDPFEAVNGKGIDKLRAAGVKVVQQVLEKECRELNRRFFIFHTQQRPYIILKWAQTADGYMAPPQQQSEEQRLHISNSFSNRLVHRWRSEEAAILVGTGTALQDNPSLTNRLWSGKSPVRLAVDKELKLPATLHLFDGEQSTVILNEKKEEVIANLRYYQLQNKEELPLQICRALYQLNLTSVLIEGGAKLFQSFINYNDYDEIRLIENTSLRIGEGLAAPRFAPLPLHEVIQLQTDRISIFCKSV